MIVYPTIKCWHCGRSYIKFIKDGWVCRYCGQSGSSKCSVETREEGVKQNCLYQG